MSRPFTGLQPLGCAVVVLTVLSGCAGTPVTPLTSEVMETPPDTVHPPAPEEVNVENDQTPDPFISGVNDSRHKAWLMDFKQAFSDTDQFYLTELDDCFEIVVSHKSANGYTGGAEAYRMDKESGKVLMLWHEHPMRLPEVEEHLESP